eukprot:10479642-Ditylum_brightwellii.AAC.1
MEVEGKILCDILELPGITGDVTRTPFPESKRIWQNETTKYPIVEATRHVKESLKTTTLTPPDD